MESRKGLNLYLVGLLFLWKGLDSQLSPLSVAATSAMNISMPAQM
jgi:hypothetical protein